MWFFNAQVCLIVCYVHFSRFRTSNWQFPWRKERRLCCYWWWWCMLVYLLGLFCFDAEPVSSCKSSTIRFVFSWRCCTAFNGSTDRQVCGSSSPSSVSREAFVAYLAFWHCKNDNKFVIYFVSEWWIARSTWGIGWICANNSQASSQRP